MVRLCSAIIALAFVSKSSGARVAVEDESDDMDISTVARKHMGMWGMWGMHGMGMGMGMGMGESCEDLDFSRVFRTTPPESGTVRGMRYAEILYGDCTSFYPDGSCETLQTTFVSSHGISDAQGWEHYTAENIASQVVNADGEHPRVVVKNGIRFFTMDEMVNGDVTFGSVRMFNAIRVAQRLSGSYDPVTICGLKWAPGGQFQTMNLHPGQLVLPSTGEPVLFSEAGSWGSVITNRVGTHCKNSNAGTVNWFLKIPRGCGASVSSDKYYFLQSVLDANPEEPPPQEVNFNRWQEIPPFSGIDAYAVVPPGYTMAGMTIPERLEPCQDELENIYIIQDEFQNSWMEVVEPPQWLLDLEFPEPPAGPCQ